MADSAETLIGKAVGPYEIQSMLGRGGVGVVYLAFDQELQRRVALKFLHDHLLNDKRRMERFKQEARAASALNHPNILTIHQIGHMEGRQFIATEFVEGGTLRQLINRSALNEIEALDIAIQIASALTAAHAAEIVHRDLKPDNVMVRPDGYIKLLDFGLAKLLEPSHTGSEAATLINTEQGTILGTVRYMSPEQVRGLETDARTDIWSLGVVLHEMLTGCPPFDGITKSDVIAAILEREPPPLANNENRISEKLRWIVAKALTKDREERYQTVKGLRSDLRNLRQQLDFQTELERSTGVSSSFESNLSEPFTTATRKRSSRSINSLAILPFVNESADPNAEYLSDGITESIINNLSQLPKLRVMARNTIFRYKGQNIDPQEAGRQLRVRGVVTGRVRQVADTLMIGTELIDIGNQAQLWGEHYQRKMSDIFKVQEEIAQEICGKLRLRLSGKEKKRLTRRHTEKSQAYQFYLKGRYFWNKRTRDGFEKAIEYFHQAIERDPCYGLAYVGLADCYQLLGGVGVIPPKESMPKAKAAVNKALEIDDELAEAHASLGRIALFHDWDWITAEKEFKRAIELNPNYPTAHHWYSICLRLAQRFDEAITEARRALDLDPLSLIIHVNLASHFYFARRYDEAIEQYGKVIEMDQNFHIGHMIGLPLEQKRQYNEAIAAFHLALKLSEGDPEVLSCLGYAFAISGRTADAQSVLDQLNKLSEKRYVESYTIAVIHAGLGETDRAFEWLEKAYENRDEPMLAIGVDPRLDQIRSDPRYTSLLKRMGLASQVFNSAVANG